MDRSTGTPSLEEKKALPNCANKDGNIINVLKNCICTSVVLVLKCMKGLNPSVQVIGVCSSHWCHPLWIINVVYKVKLIMHMKCYNYLLMIISELNDGVWPIITRYCNQLHTSGNYFVIFHTKWFKRNFKKKTTEGVIFP